MAAKHGSLSITSENIFPIIKKWLYSDHDIFYRELISNGSDAITKLKKLEMMGEYLFEDGREHKIEVIADTKEKTLTFIDNGLGMTAEEEEEYINQIAFSGATDFIEKYKDKTILISTHGASLRAMLDYIRNIPLEKFWDGGVHKNCAVTIVNYLNGRPEVEKEGIIYYDDIVKEW